MNTRLQYHRYCLLLTSFRRTEVFYHLLVPFCGPPSSFGEQFLSHQCALVQFDEFLLVDGSFFHVVGSKVRPRWGLGLALRGSGQTSEIGRTLALTQDGS